MTIILLGLILQIVFGFISGASNSFVDEVFKWKKLEYEDFPSAENFYIGSYKYHISENEQFMSIGYHPASGLMIVAILRSRPGVPTTLGAFCAHEYSLGSSPKIWKFPNAHINDLKAADFEFFTDIEGRKHHNPITRSHYKQWEDSYYNQFNKNDFSYKNEEEINIQRIVSVYAITVDERCNRVFFVDNGQVTYNRNETYFVQKPAVVVVGLPTNGCHIRNFPILKRVELPEHVISKGSDGFAFITLDYQPGDSCDGLFLYFTNIYHNYLTVYDYKTNDFWTFEHETFKPVLAECFLIFDKTFNYQLPVGIASIALAYADEEGNRMAYYTTVAGTGQYAVSTKVLKDRSRSDINYNPSDFTIIGYRGCNHQSIKTVIDYTYGVMFYAEVQSNQLRCWNISKPLNPDNIGVVYESEEYKSGAQMFIDSLGYLWFHSHYIPIVFTSDLPLNLDEVNHKIFRIKVSDAIRGTVCAEGLQ